MRTFISLPAGCLPWVLALALLGDAVGQNWKQWKDHLSYVDYAVVAIAISVFIAWLVSRGRRDARGQGSTADT